MPYLKLAYLLSLPERILRFLAASLGGLVFELTELLLPRSLRATRLYQALVYRLLRITVELVGDVQDNRPPETVSAAELVRRKTVGNAIELLSFVAVGWSPLWLLAAASDLSGGTRAYLHVLVGELRNVGLIRESQDIQSIDDLLNTLQNSTEVAADLVDVPPLNVQDLQLSWKTLRQSVGKLPDAEHLARLYQTLLEISRQEGRSVGEISTLVAGSALKAGLQLGNAHLFSYYQQEFEAVRTEGWGAYALRVARPYLVASRSHFDPRRQTLTDRILIRLGKS